ncbi:calcium-binding protein [Sphingomonas sabuli]|uniref:Calcium-binding protein n=1 Tax=Sphingomonas sabuli TaxID=2764186 RepID=A0A7G9L2R3_9SPHN|nr:calcium-binding protein [Sphingomonas sabuli]QNM82912.1 calcium-binding protein [Sphingomonas sabuli]
MATLNFYFGMDMRFFEDSGTVFHDSISGGMLTTATDTLYQIDEGTAGRDSFYGTGLSAPSQNMPFSGTVNRWAYSYDDGMGGLSIGWDFYDFSTDAMTFSNHVLNDQVGVLFSDYVMNGADEVNGSGFDDYLLGYGGNDILNGNDGNDTLDGGTGADDMLGGSGDDTYLLDDDSDVVTEFFDAGNDTVQLRFEPFVGFYILGENVENVRNLSGAAVHLAGNDLDNQLVGSGNGGEELYGADGDDYLNGGAGGNDSMYGGAGDDIFIVDSATDFVSDNRDSFGTRGDGIDEVRSSVTFSLQGSDRFDIENLTLTGTAAINGFGNAIVNTLTGNAAANLLNGGAGADIMRGGGGDDIYYADNGGDRAIETSAAGGTDTVRSSASFTLGNFVENLQLTGAEIVNGIGNGLDNRISGNNQVNVLSGNAGADVLNGNGGNDALYGGNGDDTIDGGTGHDWIEGGVGRDLMTGGAGADIFAFNSGEFGGLSAGACDRIVDFSRAQGDQIRLNTIDANSANGATSNEAFTFIGSDGFHGVAGELRYIQNNGATYVMGDTNGDGAADFMLRLEGTHNLVAGDFLL